MIDVPKELMRYIFAAATVDSRAGPQIARARISFHDLGTKGGDYCYPYAIRINRAASDDHQRETLGHEVAHLLDAQLFNGRAHGYGWAFWMRKLGLAVKQYHDDETLIRLHSGPVYAAFCYDCGVQRVYTFNPTCCQDPGCRSRDVRVTRADGFNFNR